METPEQRRERLAIALWQDECAIKRKLADWMGWNVAPAWSKPWNESGQQKYFRGKADAIIASDEAAGMVVVPVEPTKRMIRASADIDPTFPPGAADAKKYYRAMIAAAKEQA